MKIAGIGDNVIDRFMNMGILFPGGYAVNVAAHAALLGAEAAYVGSIGADREGKILKNALESLGVDLSQCIFDPEATTKKCDVNVIVDLYFELFKLMINIFQKKLKSDNITVIFYPEIINCAS